MLLALPLLAGGTRFLPEGETSAAAAAAWRSGDFFQLGRDFFETWNDGQRLVRRSRAVAIVLLGLLLFTLWRVAGRLLGPGGGAVAVLAAAFDPTLLAHGHLATIDAPFTLIALVTLVSFDAWLRRPGGLRLALAAAAFAAAVLFKFSFFALLPALAAMALAARFGSENRPSWRKLALAGGVVAAGAFLAIWAAYHFRFAAAAGGDAGVATMHVVGDYGRPLPNTLKPPGKVCCTIRRPAPTVPASSCRCCAFSIPRSCCPRPTSTAPPTWPRRARSRVVPARRIFDDGFPDYFAWAFAIKTPLATLALAALGAAALLFRVRSRPKVPPLVWGLAAFAAVYLAALHSSALNLGVRHLLPVLPLVWLLAGTAWPRPADEGESEFRSQREFPTDLPVRTVNESAHLPPRRHPAQRAGQGRGPVPSPPPRIRMETGSRPSPG